MYKYELLLIIVQIKLYWKKKKKKVRKWAVFKKLNVSVRLRSGWLLLHLPPPPLLLLWPTWIQFTKNDCEATVILHSIVLALHHS